MVACFALGLGARQTVRHSGKGPDLPRWSQPRLFQALFLASALSLQACTVLPLGRTTAPVPTIDSSWSLETGSLRLGIRVPFMRTSALESPGQSDWQLSVFVVRDDTLIAHHSTQTSDDRLDLSFEELTEGDAEIIVKLYDQGLLVGEGYTTARIRSGRAKAASVYVTPASPDDDDYPEWNDVQSPVPVQPTPAPWPVLPSDPNQYFMSQMFDSKWNPSAPTWTQNCGPASLAMVLKAYNILPPLLSGFGNPQDLIHKVRRAMMGTEDDFQLSSLEDIERGASACGIQYERTYGLDEVRTAVQSGHLVILAGNPVAYNQRFTSSQYSGFDGGHFVLVTKMTSTQAYLNDPLSRMGNITVALSELERYMAYKSWNVGISVSR